MNPKSPTPPHLILQSLFDQELPVEEAQHLRENLSADDALRLKALEEIQLLTKTHATQEADDTNLSFLWDRIEARLDPPTPKAAPALPPIPLLDRPARLPPRPRPPRRHPPPLHRDHRRPRHAPPSHEPTTPSPPSGSGPSISADVAKNNATKPPTLDASPQAEPPPNHRHLQSLRRTPKGLARQISSPANPRHLVHPHRQRPLPRYPPHPPPPP